MPMCKNTNEDGYSTDTWPKDSKVVHNLWDRFLKLVRANWKHGNPRVFCVVVILDNLMILYLIVSGDINSVFTPSLPRVNISE